MSLSEEDPDREVIEDLAMQITELLVKHTLEVEGGNKAWAELIAALGYVFATVTIKRPDDKLEVPTQWLLHNAGLWRAHLHKMMRGRTH